MKPIFFKLLLLFSLSSLAQTPQQFEAQVNQSTDDAEEQGANGENPGTIDLTSSDLELVRDGGDGDQFVGIRFENIAIPKNAVILESYIQFTVDEDDDIPGTITINTEAAANPETFSSTNFNISSRSLSSNSVIWENIPLWTTVGESGIDQRTPNLATIVKEAISQPEWNSGNPVAFILTGTGERVAEAFDGEKASAPKLIIEYKIPIQYELTIQSSSDDAEEQGLNGNSPGAIDLTSSDLELVLDGNDGDQFVGLRFDNFDVPKQATITQAYIQFTADENNEDDNIEGDKFIHIELADNSLTYNNTSNNISARERSKDNILWSNIPQWDVLTESGPDQQTPDLSQLVQTLIDRPGWNSGNSINFIILGSGKRVADSFDNNAGQERAPKIVVEYTLPTANFDLKVNNITGVETFNYPFVDRQITVEIENLGANTISNYTVAYNLDNGTPIEEIINTPLAAGDTFNYTFNQTLSVENVGNYDLNVSVDATEDEFDFNDQLSLNFTVVEQISNLYFGTNSAWSYLDDGSNQGTDWQMEKFDDSQWKIGAGHFGFGDSDEDVLLEDPHITYYFRKKVNIENLNSLKTVTLNLVSDDGAVVYVNGEEVYRSLTLPEGQINFETETIDQMTNAFENRPVQVNLEPSIFNEGINTIAIEVHNWFAGNVDLSFSAEISDVPIIYQPDGPYIFRRDNQIIVKYITENGATSQTFEENETPTLNVNLPNGDSFDFQLRNAHTIKPATYDRPTKFLVTSDIEGEIDAFIFLLQNAGVIDSNYNWSFGDAHLYFIGDLFDRGLYVTECLWLLYKLEAQALEAGGAVHFITGNHEYFNLNGNFQDAQSKYHDNAQQMGELLVNLYNNESEFGKWFRSMNIIENAGNSAIFVHAGISPEVSNFNLSYQQINDFGRIGIEDRDCPGLTEQEDIDACQAVNGSTDRGIYWYRGMANEDLSQEEVDNILTNFDGEVIIFGHTLTEDNKITPLYNQKVINIDVRHKSNFENNNYMEALLFENGCYYQFITDGTSNNLNQINPDCQPLSSNELVLEKSDLSIFPIPFESQFTIKYADKLFNSKVYIYDSLGKLISQHTLDQNKNEISINKPNLPSGIYIIRISKNNKQIFKQIIKKH